MLEVSKTSKRLLAFLVGFVLIVSQTFYLSSYNAYADTGDSGTKAAGDTILAFTSDVHNASSTAAEGSSAYRIGKWIDVIESEYGHIDAMAFGGDMGSASAGSASNFWNYTISLLLSTHWSILREMKT